MSHENLGHTYTKYCLSVIQIIFSVCPMDYLGHAYTKKVFVVYLKFKFNWASYIFSDNPIPRPSPLGWGSIISLSPCEHIPTPEVMVSECAFFRLKVQL